MISGLLPEPVDLLRHGLPVIDERDGPAQPDIVERLVRKIRREIGHTKKSVYLQCRSDVGAHPADFRGRYQVLRVQLSGADRLQGGQRVAARLVDDRLYTDMCGVVEFRILDQGHMVIGNPFFGNVGTVRDIVLGACPRVAFCKHGVARHGKHRLVQKVLQHVGRRMLQLHDQRLVVLRRNAERRRRHFAVADRFGVLDQPEIVGVGSAACRFENAPPGEDEILCRDRLPIGPDMVAHMKGPGPAVRRGFPARRSAWHRASVRRVGGEADQRISDNVRFPISVDVVRIQALDLGAVAAHQIVGSMDGMVRCSCPGAGGQQDKSGQ